ncbi:MAG: hypothetical protein PHY05_06335 [Methanothrix sp.]|nr:hypothetical protein [Methanothrix sp.]MDD2835750.1 hypothetical protein [Methanothrix sp.]MDD4446766.1 hypothetical protein [Methanothrix sp.]
MLCAKQTAAIVIILGIAVFAYYIIPSIRMVWNENAKIKKDRIAHIPFHFNAGDERGNPIGTMNIDLKVNYPHGILTVDDIIKISGVVDASRIPFELNALALYFSSSQEHPERKDSKGITGLAMINFHKTQERNVMVANEIEMKWPIEGEYHLNFPLLRPGGRPEIKTLDSPIITVHPKSAWIEVINNEAMANITIVALVLGIIGAIDIAYRLWTATS